MPRGTKYAGKKGEMSLDDMAKPHRRRKSLAREKWENTDEVTGAGKGKVDEGFVEVNSLLIRNKRLVCSRHRRK